MPHSSCFNPLFRADPEDPSKPLMPPLLTPTTLRHQGFNMSVQIKKSSLDVSKSPDSNTKILTVFAHFDTGAFRTSIDDRIAKHIGLTPTGNSIITTASGKMTASNYVIDLIFLDSPLKPFLNLSVNSCDLVDFKIEQDQPSPNTKDTFSSFGVLLGRDIQSN